VTVLAAIVIALVVGSGALLHSSLPLVGHAGPNSSPATFKDGRVLLGFDKWATKSQRRAAVAAAGAKVIRRMGAGIHLLRVPPGTVHEAIQVLRSHPGVRYAEPDYLMQEAAVPNDPSFGLQWGDQNTGQTVNGTTGLPGADERVVPAWDVTKGSRSIVIGVVDTGVEYTHPDLAANIWTNPGGIGGCPAGTHGYNVLASSCDPMDDDTVYGGHGTHVAGILGAVGDNGIGVSGVNQQTTILPVKWVTGGGSGSTSNLIAALDWLLAAKQAGVNVRVVNDSEVFVGTAYSQALSDEIDLIGQNGILFVTAAGNTGDNNDNPAVRRYPCGYARPTEICVAATNQQDALPSWANFGPTSVDLGAPGDNVYSTLRGATYGFISGSSMASPQVAGTAALILSQQDMPPTALKARILQNVDQLPALASQIRTGGRLNICKALPGCSQPTTGTFGLSTVGTNADNMVADRKRVNRFQLATAGNVSKLTMYLAPTGTSGQQLIKGVIYSDQGGSPQTLLGVSNALTFRSTDAAGWYDLTFPSPIALSAGTYWIGVISGSTSNIAGFRWRSVSGSRALNSNSYTTGPTNPFGAATIDAEQMSVYATYTATPPPPPDLFNITPPSVTGTAQQGQTLTAGNGDWTGTPTSYAYQWRRCNSGGSSCANIASATSQTYVVAAADVGSTIQVAVTASNASTSNTGYSVPTFVVQSGGTTNTFGKATVGASTDPADANWKRVDSFTIAQAVSVSKLTIYLQRLAAGQQVLQGVVYADASGTPGALLGVSNEVTFGTSATSGWFDLPFASPVTLQPGTYWIGLIDGATTDVFGLRYDSVANSGAVAADTYSDGPSNPFGPPTRFDSEQISVYATYSPATAAPVNTSLPTITGSTVQGQTLSAQQGSWTNNPTTFAYQWRDCDGSGANCVDIPGASSSSYVLTASDVNSTIRVAVTASNAGGSATAVSGPTAVVQPPAAPVNTSLPTISGVAMQGQTLSAQPGSWSNNPTSFAYQWRDCDGSGANCVDIPGATSSSYLLAASDVNFTIRVAVTASNTSGSSTASSAQTAAVLPGASGGNSVVVENQQPGTNQWRLGLTAPDAGGQIKGYASATSVNKGEDITFFVTVNPAQPYTIDVYRIGWYQGLGGRLMQHIGPLNGVQQPTCPTDATTGLIACNWTPGYTLATQTSWTSGIYLAKLTNDQGYQNYIVFTVRDDSRNAALLYQQGVDTYQAYNNYPNDGSTGKSLYGFNSFGATTVTGGPQAAKVSFDRPYSGDGDGDFLNWEVNFVRWIERSGYDVTYSTDVDTHANGARLLNYRGFLSVGHDEYWSKPMYDAAVAARDAGVNLAFFGANALFWQVRFENSASGAPNRVMVGYKSAATDPISDPSLETVNWRDPILNRPEQTLMGVQYSNQMQGSLYVPYVVNNSANWVYAGTGFHDGDTVPGIVGYEGDRLYGQYAAPSSVNGTYQRLSQSPYTADSGSSDFANSSIYQAPSGAWVFGAGTIGWSWGLDDYGGHAVTDTRIQQTTTNILDRFVAGTTGTPPPAPVNSSLPTISGLAAQGQTLNAQPGTWSNNPVHYAYQWQDCDSSGANCQNVSGATSASYVVAASDVNSTIQVQVTASNPGGSNTSSSAVTGVVQAGGTFGLTTVGTNSDQMVADRKRVSHSDLSVAGNVSKLTMYLVPTGTAGQQLIRGVIYSDRAGAPNALLGVSNQLTFNSTDQAGWYDLFFPSAVALQPGTYWIGVISGDTSNVAGIRYKSVSGARAINSNSYGAGPSDPFGSSTIDSEQMSVYASYLTSEAPPAPANVTPPTITGTAQQGSLLTAQPGTWNNNPASFAYQWRDCDSSGVNCTDIVGANSSTYLLAASDVNSTVRVAVTASNAGGSSTAVSAQTEVVQPDQVSAPANTSPPTITGSAQPGQFLTAQVGTWTNDPTSYAYQWRRCDNLGANCVDVTGSTSASYQVVSGDIGSTLRVAVTATNSAGSSIATSAQTAVVQSGALPGTFGLTTIGVNTDKMVGGRKRASHFQLSVPGTVSKLTMYLAPTTASGQQVMKGIIYADQSGAPAALMGVTNEFTFHSTDAPGWYDFIFSSPVALQAGTYWIGVISGGSNNVTGFRYNSVAGARALNTDNYSTGPANPFGSATFDTEQMSVYATYTPAQAAPANTGLPTVSGSAVQGQSMSAQPGSWSNNPTSFAYQWRDCDGSGGNCVDIPGATSSSYLLVASDVNSTVRVAVTASNAGGSSTAVSGATAVVQPAPPPAPVNTSLPTVSGSAVQGQSLSAQPGSWSNNPTRFVYQWRDCDGSGANCVDVPGATSSSYVLAASDVNSTIRVAVTASNAGGSSTAVSAATAVVQPPAAPVNTSLPTVSGSAAQGQTLSAQPGSWSNNPTSFAYQWLDCDGSGGNCVDIPGATSSSYLLVASDVNSTIRVAVTASNAGGSTAAVSSQTEVVQGPPAGPVNTGLPTVSGSVVQGQTLSGQPGSWSNNPTSFAYQWLRCDGSGNGCASIGGAASANYQLVAPDVGSTVRVAVTASNAGGSSTAVSAPTVAVAGVFGFTSVGGNSDVMGANRKRVVHFQLPADGSVSKLSMYLVPTATSGQQLLRGVIYADQAGSPSALLGVSNELTFHSTDPADWYDLAFPSPVALQAGTYWIGVISGASSNVTGFRYSNVTGSRAYNTNTYASGPSNPFGNATIDAEQMSVYATYTVAPPPAAPANTGLPTFSGSAVQGQTLSAQPGSWSNNPTGFAYQWRRCDASGGGCVDIGSATSASYVLVAADVGSTVRVSVTASNGGGSSSAVSAQSAVVAGVFGFTSVGGNSDVMGADRKRVVRVQLSVPGTVSNLSMYLAPTGTNGQQVLKGVIYADQAGVPGALLVVSNELTFQSTNQAGWYGLTFSSPIALQPGTYWIGVISGGTSNVTGFRYSIVNGARALNSNTYSAGPSNPFGTATIDAEQMSIYATYLP
jgi:Subtilase family